MNVLERTLITPTVPTTQPTPMPSEGRWRRIFPEVQQPKASPLRGLLACLPFALTSVALWGVALGCALTGGSLSSVLWPLAGALLSGYLARELYRAFRNQ